jgi:hypothetical protein
MENLHDYWSLPIEEQDQIREQADCMTEEEYQAFLNALFPPYDSLNDAMRAAGADSDE